MDLGNSADECLLHYYESIRREVEADRKAASLGSRHFFAVGDSVKKYAAPDAPQYEIKSAKTDHIAFHKASALTRLVD
jgi:hypothetical protein